MGDDEREGCFGAIMAQCAIQREHSIYSEATLDNMTDEDDSVMNVDLDLDGKAKEQVKKLQSCLLNVSMQIRQVNERLEETMLRAKLNEILLEFGGQGHEEEAEMEMETLVAEWLRHKQIMSKKNLALRSA